MPAQIIYVSWAALTRLTLSATCKTISINYVRDACFQITLPLPPIFKKESEDNYDNS